GKKALKIIFTDFLNNYNSYNIKEKIGISDVGSLKLLRNLKEKNILTSEKVGNAIFYKVNIKNEYAIKLLELVFLDHSNLSSFVKGWIYDLREFAPLTKAILLFGSILGKGKNAKDVDVCFVLKSHKDYAKLQSKVDELNKKNRLKIHPLYLVKKDFEEKLREKDKPLIDMVKNCVVVHGEDLFVEVLKNAQSQEYG
ncbi:MAG: hypothetical protein AABX63_04260, partial [Nanoarchaeota archaeon]